MSILRWLCCNFLYLLILRCTFVTGNPCHPEDHDWVWRSESSSCYLISNHTRTFQGSLDFCEELNGTLVSIADPKEDTFIQEKVRKCTRVEEPCASTIDLNEQHWIGLVKNIERGRKPNREFLKKYWRWLDGTFYNTSFMRWYQNNEEDVYEPNGDMDTECVRLLSTGYWADKICDTPIRFICEKEIYLEPPKPVNVGLAVGMTFLVLFLIAAVVLFVLWCLRRIKGMKDFDEEEPDSETMATMYYDPNIDKVDTNNKHCDSNKNVPANNELHYAEVLLPTNNSGMPPKKPPRVDQDTLAKNTDTGPISKTADQTIPKEVEAGFSLLYAIPNKVKRNPDIHDDDPYSPVMVDNEVYDSTEAAPLR